MKRPASGIIIIALVLVGLFIASYSDFFHKNSGTSLSLGSPGNGSLKNAYQINYKTRNSKYFSSVSYYLLGMGYVHSGLYHTLLDSYKECETTCPDIKFRTMECSLKEGGKALIHRTHRNGLSVDFMVPKIRRGTQVRLYDRIGLWHYLLNFDSGGRLKLNKKVEIDFETMAKHIISLDNAARKNGLTVSKVIFKIELKDDLYHTKSGSEIKRRGIYFAKNLSKSVNNLHDDHYHVDFKTVR